MQKHDAWMQWPERDCWNAFFLYTTQLTILWIVVYGGTCYITSLHQFRMPLHLDADLRMPFVPGAAVIYLSLFPMLWLSPFVLRTRAQLKSFCRSLQLIFLICGAGFLLFPSEEVRRYEFTSGISGQVFEFADWINLSYNNLPSLHVGLAVLCASVYSRSAPFRIAFWLWAWAAAIWISTLLTHQHYLIDTVAGAAVGYAVSQAAFPVTKTRSPASHRANDSALET